MSIFLALGFTILIYWTFVAVKNQLARNLVGGLLFAGLIAAVLVMMQHF